LKLFHYFISHIATSETEKKVISAAAKLFQNYFYDIEHVEKYS